MNCEVVLTWNMGQPDLVGLYFVAVKYGACAGEFQFARWEGEKWELQPEGEVEAFIDIQSFKNQLNIQWPQYTERLNRMRKAVEEAKGLLNEEFPDDVTVTGSPDFIRSVDKTKRDDFDHQP